MRAGAKSSGSASGGSESESESESSSMRACWAIYVEDEDREKIFRTSD